jgi:integrase
MFALCSGLNRSMHHIVAAWPYRDDCLSSVEPVRDDLGHASISTTSQYLHADDDARHNATEQGLKLNW